MPRVSVIVATYRRENELKRALASLKNQQYKNIEIIIVDDNALEEYNFKVCAIVEEFKNENSDLTVKLITNETNKGSAETRNIGINASEGKYITFLDDDDEYLPGKIQKQVEFMEKGNYDYTITDLDLYNESGKLIRQRIRGYIKDTSYESLFKYHFMYHITGTDAMMFTKEYLKQIEGFAPINVGDEFYLMLRAINNKGKFGYLPGCDIKAYVHKGECGLSSGEGKIIGENNLYEYKKKYFENIDSKTRRYITMRHYVVISYAKLRLRNFGGFAVNLLKGVLISPIGFFKMSFVEKI